MTIDHPIRPDWVNLSSTTMVSSLWQSLHDGHVLAVTSDNLQRIVALKIDVFYLREFHNLGDGACFELDLEGVESARCNMYVPWPGKPPQTQGLPIQEQNRLNAEYQAKWREESLGWNDFMGAFPANALDISDAELALGERVLTLRLAGMLSGASAEDRYVDVYVRAAGMAIRLKDGPAFSLSQFQQLGEEYWQWFSDRDR